MAQQLRKFVNRAPRYMLRAGDDNYLRFASERNSGKEPQSTRIINLSSSGLAFAVAQPCPLRVGELIKLEFPVPGGHQVAWWGKVVRLEERRSRYSLWGKGNSPTTPEVLVAITYVDLPEGHSRQIRDSLNRRFSDHIMAERQARRQELMGALSRNGWKIFLWGVCTAITMFFLYALSRPSGNYTAEHGSQWGERQFNWTEIFNSLLGGDSGKK